MSPEQQFSDIIFSAMGSIFNLFISAFFEVVFVPMIEAIFAGIFNPAP